jgi:small GTP-binding protein
MPLTRWQWGVLALPIVLIAAVVLVAAGWQLHRWGLNWLWSVLVLLLLAWRWLLVRWTRPAIAQLESVLTETQTALSSATDAEPAAQVVPPEAAQRAEAALKTVLQQAQQDPPLWEDWSTFWQRCQALVTAIAQIYAPSIKYPLLNIYVPQAYGLIRGTVDDLDRWMRNLSPLLNQVTVGQAYQAYETYQKLEPAARKLWQVWDWAQWLINPTAAVARQISQRSGSQATQQLLANLNQLLREAALRNLCHQAVLLYSGTSLPSSTVERSPDRLPSLQTETLRELLAQANPPEAMSQKPLAVVLVGRTGAGKSSLINSLFQTERAQVGLLPTTDQIQCYEWSTADGAVLSLWDTPGYEQAQREDLRQQVLAAAQAADLLLLATPALDPALEMDVTFLKTVREQRADLPTIVLVTQVDRLRPLREWEPPYNWQWGTRAKEVAIREAVAYRSEQLGEDCDQVLPVVTADPKLNRTAWNLEALSITLLETVPPAQQLRLARFLRDQETRVMAAAQIIERYRFQMTTSQGLTALLKSPVLKFLSTLATGSPGLALILAEKIPVEQLPLVIGKLQMAYELLLLFRPDDRRAIARELLSLWPALLTPLAPPDQEAQAFGQALIAYCTQDLSPEQVRTKMQTYLNNT